MKTTKLLFVEDGSVDLDELNKSIYENKLPIKIIVYRQGASQPKLVDIKDGGRND